MQKQKINSLVLANNINKKRWHNDFYYLWFFSPISCFTALRCNIIYAIFSIPLIHWRHWQKWTYLMILQATYYYALYYIYIYIFFHTCLKPLLASRCGDFQNQSPAVVHAFSGLFHHKPLNLSFGYILLKLFNIV